MNTRLAGVVLGVALFTFALVLAWGAWSLTRLDYPRNDVPPIPMTRSVEQ